MPSGGKREGAGRKSCNPEDKRVQMGITISQATRDKLIELADAKGMNVGRLLDQIVSTLYL